MEGSTGTPFRHAVVTGGAGFLGSHLCEALLAGGTEVTCVDDLCTAHPDQTPRERVGVEFMDLVVRL
ncbi:NAD dependent epimerase/dehydratase family protein [Streptomyces zhaozhouensis]|uniref:NAD dependent epimerase/dehydratase family protein n=1 Tax=Streptomyces zhaozhouensis TaxID=1300267 RepID=A0A286DVY2_9ACTN|nr:NAD dependent epimerase/dehydratase family protein [Streptomyces zhaozhouensis]